MPASKLQLPTQLPNALLNLVKLYNELPMQPTDKKEHLQKIFYLHQICNYVATSSHPNLFSWKNQTGDSGLESHLQRYGIHRDASFVLQNIEFAKAVAKFAQEEQASKLSYFEALRARNAILKEEFSPENLQQYINENLAILAAYNSDAKLQKRVERQLLVLGLCYAKHEAIEGFVKQNFDEYQTSVLGNPNGNNRNFTLKIAGQDSPFVIRVEDRTNMGEEEALRSYSVSEYFTEEYMAFMMPVTESGFYSRPFVISDFLQQGDLQSYVKTLQDKNEDEIIKNAQNFLGQIHDFCEKLIETGNYHPDIKLSNFLTDGERIFVSDRKTLVSNEAPLAKSVLSSPPFAPPEFKSCLVFDEEGAAVSQNLMKAGKTTLQMPAFMAYQLGMALKEFMFKGLNLPNERELFGPCPLAESVESPSKEIKNISLLIQELMRHNPDDRLKLSHFKTLLDQIDLEPAAFKAAVEQLHPTSTLSSSASIQAVQDLLACVQNGEEMDALLAARIQAIPAEHAHDPRLGLAEVLTQPHVQKYVHMIDGKKEIIRQAQDEEDYNRAPWYRKILHTLRLWNVAAVTTPQELSESVFPKMDTTTKAIASLYFKSAEITIPKFFQMPYPGLSDDQAEILAMVQEREFPNAVKPKKRQDTSSVTITRSLTRSNPIQIDGSTTNILTDAPLDVSNENSQATTVRPDESTMVRHADNSESTTVRHTDSESTTVRPKTGNAKVSGLSIYNFDSNNIPRPTEDISATVARGNSVKK